jgi:hypothetical protein
MGTLKKFWVGFIKIVQQYKNAFGSTVLHPTVYDISHKRKKVHGAGAKGAKFIFYGEGSFPEDRNFIFIESKKLLKQAPLKGGGGKNGHSSEKNFF